MDRFNDAEVEVMATGRVTQIKGFALDTNGKIVRKPHRQSVSERLRVKHSKRVRPVRRTQHR